MTNSVQQSLHSNNIHTQTGRVGRSISIKLLAILCSFSVPITAESQQISNHTGAWPQHKINDVIITYGTRSTQPNKNTPYTLHVIDAQALKYILPRTLPESLNSLPGVLVQKTAAGHGSPYIRGFTGNRTLAVIDGIRYNNATYRDGANEYFSQIDTFTLEQIELLSGPSSVLYGSDAVGGTLSLRTKDSGFLNKEKNVRFLNGSQIIRLSTGDDSALSRTSLRLGRGHQWGLVGGVSFKKFGDVNAANSGSLPHTGYSETAWDIRFDARLNDNWHSSLAHQSLRQDDVWRTHSTIFSVPFAGTTIGTDKVRLKDHARSLSYVKVTGQPGTALLSSAELTLSRQTRREDALRIREDDLEITQGFNSNLYAFNSVFESSLSDITLIYGLDISHENIDSKREDFAPSTNTLVNRIQGPVGDDAHYRQVGIFAQSSFALTQALELELGGRLSNIHAKIEKYEDPWSGLPINFNGGWSNFSGSGRVNYKWGSTYKSNIWFSMSESFRAPNIADISRFGRSRSTEFETASFDLNPEKFITTELGYRRHSDNFKISTVYYYTHLRDYIDTIPTGRIIDGLTEVSKSNSASGHIQGVELTGEFSISDTLSVKGNATWLDGQVSRLTSTGNLTEPISRIMPATVNFSLNWAGVLYGTNEDIWLSSELKFVSKAHKLSAGDLNDTQRIPVGGTPNYTLINIHSSWAITDKLQINLSANNLLNTAYRAHGSGSNEAGRHIILGVSLAF